jgi:hypothetical protein
MRRTIALVICAGLWPGATVSAAEHTITGVVSDSHCGAKHGMANMSDRECTQMCTSQGTQYVLVVGDKLYKLTNRDSDLKTHAGHTVNLTGDVKGDTIRVSKIEMPKDPKN